MNLSNLSKRVMGNKKTHIISCMHMNDNEIYIVIRRRGKEGEEKTFFNLNIFK